jgi:tetratricopeptide (TPR) repeat protein
VNSEYKYRAFISYSHKDEEWASWLHKALETFKVPKYLVGETTAMGTVPERMGKVFRDREELSSSHSLGTELTQALEDSACQIVICSPNAAKSHWTNEEILTYKRLGREDRIFCLIADGEPGADQAECFPPAVRFHMGADGVLSDEPAEPIAADARPHADGKQNAKLKLISGMLGVEFDALKQREQQRRHKRMLFLTVAAIAGMFVTSGLAALAVLARNEAEIQRAQAEIDAETARQTTRFMVDLFEVSDPSEALGNSITAREILDKGAARIEDELTDQPAIQAVLMDTMGAVYKSLGLYDPAASLVSQALEKRSTLFGAEHVEVAQSLNHLGEVQTLQADYEDAERNLLAALAVRRKLRGNSHAEVADTLSDLAYAKTLKGEYNDAEPLIRESLSIRRNLYEAAHADIAESLEFLGLNMYDQGRYDAAVVEMRAAVAMRRAVHGEKHPDLAAALTNLAFVLEDVNEFEAAEKLYQDALNMQRALYTETHPWIGVSLNNIGLVRARGGDYDGAEAAFREALKIRHAVYGDEHPEIAITLSNLALTQYAVGDNADAIVQMRAALSMSREVLGTDHPDVASSALTLASWLTEEQKYEEAELLLAEGDRIRRGVYGNEHPLVANTLVVKANLVLAQERFDDALALAEAARATLMMSLPNDHWSVAAAESAAGAALAGLGSYADAEPLLLRSLGPLEHAPVPGIAEKNNERLANLYTAWGKPEKAKQYAIRE